MLELIDIIMSEMTAVIRGIIEKVDAFISDKFCPFKVNLYEKCRMQYKVLPDTLDP